MIATLIKIEKIVSTFSLIAFFAPIPYPMGIGMFYYMTFGVFGNNYEIYTFIGAIFFGAVSLFSTYVYFTAKKASATLGKSFKPRWLLSSVLALSFILTGILSVI